MSSAACAPFDEKQWGLTLYDFWLYCSAPQPFLNHDTLIKLAKLGGTPQKIHLKPQETQKNNMIYARTSMRYLCLF